MLISSSTTSCLFSCRWFHMLFFTCRMVCRVIHSCYCLIVSNIHVVNIINRWEIHIMINSTSHFVPDCRCNLRWSGNALLLHSDGLLHNWNKNFLVKLVFQFLYWTCVCYFPITCCSRIQHCLCRDGCSRVIVSSW